VAIIIAAAAVVVRGSFHRASRLETPSSLLADHDLWGTQVRLVGVVSSGSIKVRPNRTRFAVMDERGSGRVIVQFAGDSLSQLRAGRQVEVTGTFGGRRFEAQPSTLVVICGRPGTQDHC